MFFLKSVVSLGNNKKNGPQKVEHTIVLLAQQADQLARLVALDLERIRRPRQPRRPRQNSKVNKKSSKCFTKVV